MDLRSLVRDKRLVAVAGVGVLAGAFVLLRGRGAGGGSSSTSLPGGTPVGSGVGTSLGTADTLSSDVASTLSAFSADQQATMTAFADSITDQLDLISTRQPATPATSAASTSGTVSSKLSGATVSGGKATTAAAAPARTLAPGYGWFATGSKTVTLGEGAKKYGTTTAALQSMNSKLKGLSATSALPKNTPVKVRSNAGAWDLAAYRKVNK